MTVFNPVKIEEGDQRAKRVVWSTKSIELAKLAKEKGQKLIANPFLDGNNINLLKPELVFERTDWEINEWARCSTDIIYFANTYCKLMTPEGIQSITLRDYQKDYLQHLIQNKLSIFLSCRQSGKTTTTAIFILWYLLFNIDKNALVLGNKRKTAIEILDKLKKIFLELPFFLKPGVYKWNDSQITLDNGCQCMAESTTQNSGISFTFHCVLADEFAHVPENIATKFYSNIYPTIIAGSARFIISSTQNGYNLFYKLWISAVSKENDYAPFKVDWWQVPDWDSKKKKWIKRTEQWKNRQIANLGSEEAFNSQFGTSFSISSSTLISTSILEKLRSKIETFISVDGFPNYFFWKPHFNPTEELKSKYICITCDLAEGVNGDYTVFNFWEITGEDSVILLGYFRSNTIRMDQCIESLLYVICTYTNTNQILLSWEKNTYGDYFYKSILTLTDLGSKFENFDTSCFVKYGSTYGIRLTSGNKTVGCLDFKTQFEKKYIINTSDIFCIELEKFSSQDGGKTYKASFGHDDMVLATIQLSFLFKTPQYQYLNEEIKFQNEILLKKSNNILNFTDNIYSIIGNNYNNNTRFFMK